MKVFTPLLLLSITAFLSSCAVDDTPGAYISRGGGGVPLGNHPHPDIREQQIATEERGNFYYGRRYFVKKTRFWGYLRKPGQPWSSAKLVIFNEKSKRQPDRLREGRPGTPGFYAYDQNYEYKIRGNYTGRTLYEPNSNQFLPEFRLTGYELRDKNPGWLFSPNDRYDPMRITVLP